jgi:hypothetical protein
VQPKKRTSDRSKSQVAKPSYEPNSQERDAIEKHLVRIAASTGPRVKVLNDGNARRISPDHPHDVIGQVLLREGQLSEQTVHKIIVRRSERLESALRSEPNLGMTPWLRAVLSAITYASWVASLVAHLVLRHSRR